MTGIPGGSKLRRERVVDPRQQGPLDLHVAFCIGVLVLEIPTTLHQESRNRETRYPDSQRIVWATEGSTSGQVVYRFGVL
jgi:hypothetical protein